jgi:hypothetical protein
MWQTVNLGDAKISTAPLDERTAERTVEAPASAFASLESVPQSGGLYFLRKSTDD